MKLYQAIARTLRAILNCEGETVNHEWLAKHKDELYNLARCHLPSGSGIDNGCEIDRDASTDNRLVITFSFHHMDDNGYYDGWSDYKCIIKPCLMFGIDIKIVGNDRNQIKDYLHETLQYALTQEI